MQQVKQALDEVKELYQKVLGRPAPDLDTGSFVSFPAGVDPLRHAVSEVEHLRNVTEQVAMAPQPASWFPLADCYMTEDTFVARLEVPGIDRKDLKVFLAGGDCIVRGERKRPERPEVMRAVAFERPWGPFERRFPLPEGEIQEEVNARCENGVLEVRIPVKVRKPQKETTVEVA